MIDRRYKNGYSNLGAIQIPPLPQAVVLTDRADGSLWMVSFNPSPIERLSINSVFATIKALEGVRLYGPDDGPLMDEDGEFKLIIRSGHLGFEYLPFPVGIEGMDTAPEYARNGSSTRQLNMDNTNPSTAHLGYIAP